MGLSRIHQDVNHFKLVSIKWIYDLKGQCMIDDLCNIKAISNKHYEMRGGDKIIFGLQLNYLKIFVF